uniref:Uncharacterized protein n=1 Tax=Falco tinnunculus TaxID=100819 RepID=A0A8C4UR23_FALTI
MLLEIPSVGLCSWILCPDMTSRKKILPFSYSIAWKKQLKKHDGTLHRNRAGGLFLVSTPSVR